MEDLLLERGLDICHEEGKALKRCVTKSRDTAAALCFVKKAPKRQGLARGVATVDPQPSVPRRARSSGKLEVGRWANSRVENGHLTLDDAREPCSASGG